CPYRARHLIHEAHWYFPGGPTPSEAATDQPERPGVMTQCTFCVQRVDTGRMDGLEPGVDAAATPMCSVACIANAIHFGDLDDPQSVVSRLLRDRSAVQLLPECGTDPSVYYLTD
ncbi:MAG: 4Fe-4S dicluster domain-containing protein, partial [Candidatus Rokubacteria bacterium]|nr:4Fe-4S dicluster domain-containing protein [Candidatus Rokubacteria bacterium]